MPVNFRTQWAPTRDGGLSTALPGGRMAYIRPDDPAEPTEYTWSVYGQDFSRLLSGGGVPYIWQAIVDCEQAMVTGGMVPPQAVTTVCPHCGQPFPTPTTQVSHG